jgi:hypothetical protein
VKPALVVSLLPGAKLVLSGHIVYPIICISRANTPRIDAKDLIQKAFLFFSQSQRQIF